MQREEERGWKVKRGTMDRRADVLFFRNLKMFVNLFVAVLYQTIYFNLVQG